MKIDGKSLLKIGIGAFVLYLCIHYWSLLTGLLLTALGAAVPLLLGCVIAYLVNILMRKYERRFFPKSQKAFVVKGRRPICMLGAFVTLLAVVALVVWLVVPQLVSCVQLILAELPGAIEETVTWAQGLGILPENLLSSLENINWQERLDLMSDALTVGLGGVMGVAGMLIGVPLAAAIYRLLRRDVNRGLAPAPAPAPAEEPKAQETT